MCNQITLLSHSVTSVPSYEAFHTAQHWHLPLSVWTRVYHQSVSDVERYIIIILLLDTVINMFPVFISLYKVSGPLVSTVGRLERRNLQTFFSPLVCRKNIQPLYYKYDLKVCDDGTLVQILRFWTLSIVSSLSKMLFCSSFNSILSPSSRTSSIDWTQLNRFYLKTGTESSLRNSVFWKRNMTTF
jgi:hypothetical protein